MLAMNSKKLIILVIIFATAIVAFGQNLKPLDHTVYDDWKSIESRKISDNGNWIAYEINPQEGDGKLFIYDKKRNLYTEFDRGKKPLFSPNSNFIVFKIVPEYDTVRKAKLKKVKKDKMPKDSLGVYIFDTKEIIKYPDLQGFKMPEKEADWIAIAVKSPTSKPIKDTINTDTTSVIKKKQNKSSGKKGKDKKSYLLVMLNPITGDSIAFNDVARHTLSKDGSACAFVQISNDSIDSLTVSLFETRKMKTRNVFNGPGYNANISIDENGTQLAFTYSNDSVKEKAYGLFYFETKMKQPKFIVDTNFHSLIDDWSVSENGKIYFNEKGDELYFGTAPKPIIAPKDTLTKDEKVSVDIWNWKDLKLQPQQLKELEREKKRSYVAVYFTESGKTFQLADKELPFVTIDKKSKGDFSLGYDTKPYQRMTSWEASRYRDIYLVDRSTRNRQLVLEKIASSFYLSPDQKYILWYNISDSTWNSYNVEKQSSAPLTNNRKVNFYYELNDVPNEAYSYGFCGWTRSGQPVVYDKYDLWMLDPSGKKDPICLTNGYGRTNKLSFRYIKLDKDEVVLPKNMMLSAFDNKTKGDGFYTLSEKSGVDPEKLIMEEVNFSRPVKARDSEEMIFTKSTFKDFPDLYVSNLKLENIHKITNANPQQSEYLWGDVKLVSWVSFNGDTMQGMLYTPENLDPNIKYPMLVYFYERYSNRLHSYITPRPIRSVINFSYYVSNGYVIFIPDIKYRTGYPGASAYDCIVSGTQAMCDEYDFIDRANLGIQGQSWGGYQVAYLVTRTDMYKAAMAGAPVSNMTSAYGGIRWGSGLSRAFQYEQTQSRIGGNLWDKLPLYMENSPLFYLDRVNTPLLIMHNDKDGAVPWYQGIELFNGLRRLDKPVWMLVYNGGPHNLKRRADCKDLTVRMQQFFDHYLKGAPEPVWMKYGVPAINKGKEFGFEMAD